MRKRLSDNPLYCGNRDNIYCKTPNVLCPNKKKLCCFVCGEVNKCYLACPKVLSFLSYLNPAKLPKKELDELIRLRREGVELEVGNPSERKKKDDRDSKKIKTPQQS